MDGYFNVVIAVHSRKPPTPEPIPSPAKEQEPAIIHTAEAQKIEGLIFLFKINFESTN